MLEGNTDQRPGRPMKPLDEHRQRLDRQLAEARRQIDRLTHQLALKEVMRDLKLMETGCDRAKKRFNR